MSATRWDARVLARAALASAVALALAWLITMATDEGGVSLGERAGRALPLVPACAALGAWIALAPVRSRGEALALAALGRSPAQVAAPAVAGAALFAMTAAVAMGTAPSVDVGPFFPRAAHASAWEWQGGAFVDHARGLRVGIDGVPVVLAPEGRVAVATIPPAGRAAASIATALAGLALPLLVASALLARSTATGGMRNDWNMRDDGVATLASGGAIAASIVLFHSAATRRLPALFVVVPPLALLAFAVRRYREAR